MTAIFALVMSAFTIVQLYALRATVNALEARHDARLKALEQGRKAEATKVHVVPDWQKPIEGFEPEKPEKILPRSKEQKAARVVTEWEINSDFKIIG